MRAAGHGAQRLALLSIQAVEEGRESADNPWHRLAHCVQPVVQQALRGFPVEGLAGHQAAQLRATRQAAQRIPLPLQLASLLVLLPWLAACTRRLRDAGFNPWWQLISLAPVAGILVLLYLLAYPTKAKEPPATPPA